MKKLLHLIPALGFLAQPLIASIDWEGDTSKTASGLDTWVIAEAAFASTAPEIDGVIAAGEWDAATTYELSEVYHVVEYDGTLTARFKVQWDETYLYVVVEAEDDLGMAERGHKFELYVSTSYTRKFGMWQLPGYEEFDYQISSNMQPIDAFYTLGLYSDQDPLPSFLRANTVNGAAYVSEVRIAWADLGGLPSTRELPNTDYIGFEVHVQRNAPAGGHQNRDRTKRGWAGITDTAWAATEDFGTLRLMPAGDGPDPVSPWADIPKAEGLEYKETGIGWVYDDHYPAIYHAGSESWYHVLAEISTAESMYMYSVSGDYYLWTADAIDGYYYNLSDPTTGTSGWSNMNFGSLR